MFKKASNMINTARQIASEFAGGFIEGFTNSNGKVQYIKSERDAYVSLMAQLELVELLSKNFKKQDCFLIDSSEIFGWHECQDDIDYELFTKKNELLAKLNKMGVEISPHKPNYLKFNK